MENVLLKCNKCNTVNRVLVSKFNLKPKCHSCKNLLEWPTKPVEANSINFRNEVINNPGFVLVEFWTPTCGYCHSMNPTLDKFAQDKAGIVKLVKINSVNSPDLAVQFNIMGVPSFILFNGGKKTAEISGAMNAEQLDSWIRQYTN
jgi:thioredoxin 2